MVNKNTVETADDFHKLSTQELLNHKLHVSNKVISQWTFLSVAKNVLLSYAQKAIIGQIFYEVLRFCSLFQELLNMWNKSKLSRNEEQYR